MPLALPARDLVVQWGGVDLASLGVQLNSFDSSFRVGIDYFRSLFSVEMTLRLAAPIGNRAGDEQAFAALEATLESTLKNPRQRLLVTLAGQTQHDWNPDPAVKSAFQLYPTLTKLGKNTDSGLSSRWSWSVSCGRPATLAGQNFRQSSSTATTYTINGRRAVAIDAIYTASANSTALQNYQNNIDAFAASVLPAPVTNGEWIFTEDTPPFEDENAVCTGRRLYWEVVAGLRDYTVHAAYDESRLVEVSIVGVYTKCAAHASAYASYNADIQARSTAILQAFSGVNFNAWNQPNAQVDTKTLTDEILHFTRTYRQIAYQAGPSGPQDPNVVRFRLDVNLDVPWTAQSGGVAKVARLRFGTVSYQASIDFNSAGGTDPYSLWLQKFRGYCLTALGNKLQATQFLVLQESPGVGLDRNVLFATLKIIVFGGSTGVLEYHVRERRRRTASKRRIPRADGTPRSYALMPQPTERVYTKSVRAEYMSGFVPDAVLVPGETLSGFTFTDTGRTANDDLIAQEGAAYQPANNWMCDFEDTEYEPSSRGPNDELSTVTVNHVEQWTAIDNVEPAPQAIS
jgi:hypothetical protein